MAYSSTSYGRANPWKTPSSSRSTGARDECLNVHQFTSIDDAKAKIEAWRVDDNQRRPHSSLGHLTPNEYVAPSGSAGRRNRFSLVSTVSIRDVRQKPLLSSVDCLDPGPTSAFAQFASHCCVLIGHNHRANVIGAETTEPVARALSCNCTPRAAEGNW